MYAIPLNSAVTYNLEWLLTVILAIN